MSPGPWGALGVFGISTAVAWSREVPPIERRVFRSVNGLSDSFHPPAYVVMQSGSLAAVFVAAGVARRLGRRQLATAVVVTGVTVWGGAKVVKHGVGRGRPTDHVEAVHVRGNESAGLGFPSGHTAVAFCLAALVAPQLAPPLRRPVWALAAAVGAARVYVGAHLPLDVVGGAALGIAAARGTQCREHHQRCLTRHYSVLDATRS